MKTLLNKKLFACIIIIMLFCSTTNAQIIYTDVNPDQIFDSTGSVYYLDLNNDGIHDFSINKYNAGAVACRPHHYTKIAIDITPLNNNEVGNRLYSSQDSVAVVFFNELIDGTAFDWSNIPDQNLEKISFSCQIDPLSGICMFCFPRGFGTWVRVNNQFIALRLHVASMVYYGWLRLSVTYSGGLNDITYSSFTINDYAYNSIPNQPIFAGEGGEGGPLRLTFLSFDGVLKNNAAELTWSTVNEINNKGFEVEKSTDGQNFVAIGFVKGKGNTSSVSHYNFTDAALKSGANFYRLKQIDYDGNFSYSAVIQIHHVNTNDYQVAIAPNPFLNSTTISFILIQPQKVSIRIYDMTGRVVKTLVNAEMQAGTHQILWNAGDEKGKTVNAGIYLLKTKMGNFSETKKLSVIK